MNPSLIWPAQRKKWEKMQQEPQKQIADASKMVMRPYVPSEHPRAGEMHAFRKIPSLYE